MTTTEILQAWATEAGADYCGVADLTLAARAIAGQGGEFLLAYPRAVVLGLALPNAIVDLLPRRNERAIAVQYFHHSYNVLNTRLDQLASKLASRLQREGYRVFPLSASERVDDERISALFSHKLAARLAGLGWIGKNCLLITPTHGPRVRWISILTDAPLVPAQHLMEDRCGDCRECVEACPQQALTGRHFISSEEREIRFQASKCDQYFKAMKPHAPWFVCGMCLYACPHGKGKPSGNG